MYCVIKIRSHYAVHPPYSRQQWLRLFFQGDLASPRSEGLRLVALLLMLIMLRVMFNGVPIDVKSNVASFLSFTSALLMASSLFNTQALCRQYHYYLASLPVSKFKLQIILISYVMLKALPGVTLIAYLDIFEKQHWALWSLFYVTSLLGILYLPKWFFTFPAIGAVLVFILT